MTDDRESPRRRARRVAVVGGGLAGVAAATVLAERRVHVVLFEAQAQLGGRLAAWPDRLAGGDGDGDVTMERGFHAFFRQYHNLRALLRRIDPSLSLLQPVPDYPLVGPGGAAESFAGLPRRPPFNLAALVRRTSTLRWRDLRALDGPVAGEMLEFDPARTYARWDGVSAADYLDAVGFPPDARRMLFEVFAHSFFNDEATMSAAELLAMFHFYFLGNDEGLLFDVLTEPFSDAVWGPLGRHLDGLGVDVRLGEPVQSVEARAEGGWRVAGVEVDGVVLALDVAGLQSVVSASPALGDTRWREAVASLTVAPPFAVWRAWLDRPLDTARPPFVGTAGLGVIDNIAAVHRYQGEARGWAAKTGGSVIEAHAYALPPGRGPDDVHAELRRRVHELWPETATAGVVDERFLWRQDCPGFEVGSHDRRPGVGTSADAVVLAGDFVRLPFPSALMERAVASGFVAANHLLGRWGLPPVRVRTIRRRGVLAWLGDRRGRRH